MPILLALGCQSPAAINFEDLARDFESLLGSQENNCFSYLFFLGNSWILSISLKWCIIAFSFWKFFDVSFRKTSWSIKVRVNVRWGDGIHSYSISRKLNSNTFSHHLQTSFHHTVAKRVWIGPWSFVTAQINYTPIALNEQILEQIDQDKWRSEINIKQIVIIHRESSFRISSKDIA